VNETERQLVTQLAELVEDLALALEIPAAAHEARQIVKALRAGWGSK